MDSTAFAFLRDRAILLLHWVGPGLLENQPWAVVSKGVYGIMVTACLPGGVRNGSTLQSSEREGACLWGTPIPWGDRVASGLALSSMPPRRPSSSDQQLLGVEGKE